MNGENTLLQQDVQSIIHAAFLDVMPDKAVKKTLGTLEFDSGEIVVIAVGKAAWQMAQTASGILRERISRGLIITKYGHSKGAIPGFDVCEAGHPIPDENSFLAAEKAMEYVQGLTERDTVLFLLSGGGSALFEKPAVSGEAMQQVTDALLRSGADIVEMNIVRKRLSQVKGGKFALACKPAHVCNIILSDIIGDPLDMIASGPTCEDRSTSEQAMEIIDRYGICITDEIKECLRQETPKNLKNIESHVIGSVEHLCLAAVNQCEKLGYRTRLLTTAMTCQAKEAGRWLAGIAQENKDAKEPLAFVAGGETVVKVKGCGKGGRNQELALSAAASLDGLEDIAIFSVSSDGTDGPTDAAGGYVDGDTLRVLSAKKISVEKELDNNNSYYALKESSGLIVTGPTGTNVNDFSVLLIKR